MGQDAEMEMNRPDKPEADAELQAVQHLLNEKVVVDTPWSLVYIGRLTAWSPYFVTLEEVDVHDLSQGTSSKDTYIHTARKHGIQLNRRQVLIRKSQVVSLSALDDVIAY